MNKNRARALAEGAVCTALTVLLMVIAIYVPLFTIFSTVIVGLPIVFMAVRHGLRRAGISALAAVLVTVFLLGDIVSALMMALLHLLPQKAVLHNRSFCHRGGTDWIDGRASAFEYRRRR